VRGKETNRPESNPNSPVYPARVLGNRLAGEGGGRKNIIVKDGVQNRKLSRLEVKTSITATAARGGNRQEKDTDSRKKKQGSIYLGHRGKIC